MCHEKDLVFEGIFVLFIFKRSVVLGSLDRVIFSSKVYIVYG